MVKFRDPNAPAGRVVFGGVAFHDGVTADIDPGPGTLELFKSAGITAVPDKPAPVQDEKPAKSAAKPAK